MRGLENILVDVMINQDMVDYLQERFVSFFIEDFHRTMEAAGGKIDVFWALTDLGTQERLLMGREAMDRYIFKPLKRMADVVHREGVKLMFHSCGAVREVIPELISCGVDILNPLQPAAKGMEPAGLKKDFGANIAFHGGIDIQYLLPQKPPAVVAAEAGRVGRILCDQGGTCFRRPTISSWTRPRRTSWRCTARRPGGCRARPSVMRLKGGTT